MDLTWDLHAGRHVKIRADLLCGRLPQREVAATPAAIDRVLTAAQIAFSTELVHTIPIHTKQEILLPLTAQPHLPPLFTTRRCPICLSYWCKVLEKLKCSVLKLSETRCNVILPHSNPCEIFSLSLNLCGCS
ncbi:hypothetical protein SASPL_152061 [Salvia splendens]|uniref:Uncharacterized protein n=1 Tax=Salvia splendens TaxID=180675 RepID=A0A8X8W2V6_SALSN|nr:hypothetical protein SASPL_152061 [Salvia splendens]